MVNHYYALASVQKVQKTRDPGREEIGWPDSCPSCGRGMRLGMIDGPVDCQSPALAGQWIERRFFFNRKDTAKMNTGHGTAIAALMIGRGATYTGLLPGAHLHAAAAFTGTSADTARGTALSVVRALDWLVSRRVMVINASFTGPDNLLVRQAMQKTARKNILVVAAAGNHGPDGPPLFPAAYDEVIAVTAVDRFQHPYSRANRGDYIDLAAPGVRVPVPCAGGDNEICYRSGTSFAAPYCTAVAVALAKGGGTDRGTGGIRGVRNLLEKTALDLGAPGRDPIFGAGLVRCGRLCRKQLR